MDQIAKDPRQLKAFADEIESLMEKETLNIVEAMFRSLKIKNFLYVNLRKEDRLELDRYEGLTSYYEIATLLFGILSWHYQAPSFWEDRSRGFFRIVR